MLPTIAKEESKKTNDYINFTSRKPIKAYEYFNIKISKITIDTLCRLDKDERYLYFLKYGILRRFEGEGEILYVEIPQIPKNLVIYRRPSARNKSSEKLYLNKKDLPHIPLLEGEEYLKFLSLEANLITKIDHLISLNNLLFLNLYENKITEIENLSNVPKLKALMLGKNMIEKIKNLNCLQNLEVLDLHSNKIKLIENLSFLKKLRILNLANNQITSFVELMQNKGLEEINLRKNLIVSIPNLTNNFEKVKKINLGKNMIAKVEFLLEFKKLKNLSELFIEDNPVLFLKDTYSKLIPLPIQAKDNNNNNNNDKDTSTNLTNKNNNNNDKEKNNNGLISGSPSSTNLSGKERDKEQDKSTMFSSYKNNNNNMINSTNNFNHNNSESQNFNNQTSRDFRRNLTSKINNNKNSRDFTQTERNIMKNINELNSIKNNNNNKNSNNNPSNNIINPNNNIISNNNNIKNNRNANEDDNNINLSEEERSNLLEKIKAEWEMEYKFITENGFNGYNIKKLKETKMQLYHVEIEREKQLNLFGNSIEVLSYTDFHFTIHTIQIEFLNYDIVTMSKNLENLKKFVNLRSILFSHNNIHSFYQLIKLEEIKNLEYVTIKNNEICNSNLLKYFLVYRLQNIKYFNDTEITNKDILLSKKLFEFFDQAISNCETENEKHKAKMMEENKEKNKYDKDNNVDKKKFPNNILDYPNEAAIQQINNILKSEFINYTKKNIFTVLDDLTDF